ncbi:MAG: hypothetical protein KDI38_27980, partial [Calditrichaeota bacterium]|nr:hypothetical protein [Calditrichota bacterium]
TKRNVIAIMEFIRNQNSLQNCLIVLGGPDVTHNTGEYLGAGADLLVIGEGEQTLLEIAEHFRVRSAEYGARNLTSPEKVEHSALRTPHSALVNIPGLAYRLPDGSVHRTAPREKIRDLDALPLPNRPKIDLQQYLDAWKKAHGHSAVSLSTQRGCPYTCRWCSTAVYGQSYRRRSPKAVVDEIAWLQAHYD